MKQFLLATAIIFSVAATAQSEKYTQAMQQNLTTFDSAKTTADYEASAASFQRIGDAEKTQWLPYYWSALSLTSLGWRDAAVNKDDLATRVNALADKADALATDNAAKAEILTLRNMAATQQMLVDPQNRYMTYGQQAASALQKAMELDSNNPRLYYLQGMSIFGTPEQFGGGKAKAKPIFQKAVDLGKAEQVKPIYPHWSLEQSQQMLAQCE